MSNVSDFMAIVGKYYDTQIITGLYETKVFMPVKDLSFEVFGCTLDKSSPNTIIEEVNIIA